MSQDKTQTLEIISIEVINACLHAIDSSIEHFQKAKSNMKELAIFLQEDNARENSNISFKSQPKNNEPLCINKVNYIAILSLEQLGIPCPTQEQIDTMESIILLAMKPEKLTKENIKLCIGKDNVAKRVLLRVLKEHY